MVLAIRQLMEQLSQPMALIQVVIFVITIQVIFCFIKKLVEEEGRYVNVKATTSTCEAYTTNNSALVYTEVPKCKYMKGGSDECFLCEDKYSFSWNTNNKECTSNDGKLQICWKFSNEIGSGCDKCYIGYIMINEITCKAASNLMIGMGLVSLIVMIMNLINF